MRLGPSAHFECICIYNYLTLWSRWRFVRFAADEKRTTLRLLAECFEELSGVPGVVLSDRMGCLKAGTVANLVLPHPDYVRFAAHMRAVEIVEVLPLLELGVEDLGVIHDHALEHAIELVGVDPVGSLDPAVEAGCGRLDVEVANALVQDMPVERRAELGAVVGLDQLDSEGKLLEGVVDKLDRGLLVEPVIDLEHPKTRAVVNGGELVVLLSRAGDRRDELDVDLEGVPGLR
jgi:hypothetical protein